MSSDWVVIGHRGFPERYPENSLVGIFAAIDGGAGGVEVDVHLSSEGVPVVIHDATVQRTTRHNWPQLIHQLNLAKLSQVSVHEPHRFGEQYAPCKLLTLEALCEAYAACGKPLFIELKSSALQAFTAEQFVYAVMQASKAIPSHLKFLISFNREIVCSVKKQAVSRAGWVLESFSQANLNLAAEMKVDVLIIDIERLPSLEPLSCQAWDWFVYDIVDPGLAKRCAEKGVKYIESWNPPLILPG